MPRTTRAAARAQETGSAPQLVFEDAETSTQPEDAVNVSQPAATTTRTIFGELTGNDVPTVEPKERTVIIYAMPAKKVKGKKGRPRIKKNKFELELQIENDSPMVTEVLEDENQSETSDAADAAAEELRRDERPPETFQVPMDSRPRTPPSAAAKEATNNLLRSLNKNVAAVQGIPPTTPKFNPAVHKEGLVASLPDEDLKEDSFVKDIAARSPAKATLPIERLEEDSFIESIITRSSTRTIPRIEDSVAEMDALDEAIERVAEILPVLEERDLESPTTTRDMVKPGPAPSTKRTTAPAAKPASKAPKVRPSPVKANPGPIRSSTSRPSTVRVKPTVRASVLPNKLRAVSIDTSSSLERRGLSFSASPTKVQPNTTQKIRKTSTTTSLSTSKPGFVPAKSNKATTTSSFSLPGEAIAAKLKAQREERQKRMEEATAKEAATKVVQRLTTALKTRPRLSATAAPVVKPRETQSSQAKQSLMFVKSDKRTASGSSNKENVTPSKIKGQPAIKTPTPKAKEPTVIRKPSGANVCTVVKKASTMGAGSVRANSAVRRTGMTSSTSAIRKDSITPSPSSGSGAGAKKSTMNKADPLSQRGKVFGRENPQKVEMDRMRREKEDAAKRARAEAAERGRIASREWAEKQKKKLASAAAAEAAKKQKATSSAAGGVAQGAAGV